MKIVDFLKKENCVASLSSDKKEDVLKELCDLLVKNGDVSDSDAIYDAVINRERLGSTGIGEQVAIPHAKSNKVDSLVAAFGVSRRGIEYYAVDDQPVRLVFLLLASENSTGDHLKALAKISRLMKNEKFRKEIERVKSADDIYELIAKENDHLE